MVTISNAGQEPTKLALRGLIITHISALDNFAREYHSLLLSSLNCV